MDSSVKDVRDIIDKSISLNEQMLERLAEQEIWQKEISGDIKSVLEKTYQIEGNDALKKEVKNLIEKLEEKERLDKFKYKILKSNHYTTHNIYDLITEGRGSRQCY
ncbi:MAG: hypothetical protein PWP31_2002 [Clostridia bacterium]|nr:hypothetical protein [Clostridia bacterium]